MIINILSATQASSAIRFSRPDLYPEPFSSVSYFLSKDDLPILEGSLGALSCKMMPRTLPLHDLDFLEKRSDVAAEKALEGEGLLSELFIARVVRVEKSRVMEKEEDNRRNVLPLLYHQQEFTVPLHPNLKS
jgi:flavin reductase (DIM6/NTAB) family NADH-FMN oxidoreductase RutF